MALEGRFVLGFGRDGLCCKEAPRQLGEALLKDGSLRRAPLGDQAAQNTGLVWILLEVQVKLLELEPQLSGGRAAVKRRLEALRDQIDRFLVRVSNAELLQRFEIAAIVFRDLGLEL